MKMSRTIGGLLTALLLAGSLAACGSRSSDSVTAEYYSEAAVSDDAGWSTNDSAFSEESAIDTDGAVLTGTEQEAGSAGETSERKLIRNMELSLETTEFDHLIAVIEDQTEEMGGYVESSSIDGTPEKARRYGYLTIRIPAEKLDSFEDILGDSATVLSKNSSVQDVTLSYSDLAAHISSLRIEQQTLMEMLEQADSIDTIITIQNELTNIRYQLESYESQMKVLENQITYSTVYITVHEVQTPTVQEKEGFFTRLKYTFLNSIQDLGEGIEDFLIFFLGNIVTIIVYLAVLVGILFVLRALFRFMRGNGRKRQKKQKKAEKESEDSTES